MGGTSKDLLHLERNSSSSSSIKSKLLVYKSDLPSRSKKSPPDEKPSMVPLPPSQFLGKVKDFLGVMSEANKKLELDVKDESRTDYNIEVITGDESQYIEMDLMLGVADLHTPEAVAAANSAIAGYQPVIPLPDSDEDSDTDEDDENALPSKKRPKIIDISEKKPES